MEVKLLAADAERVEALAGQAGIKPPALLRQAVQAFLAAQSSSPEAAEGGSSLTEALPNGPVPVESVAGGAPDGNAQPVVTTTITTEPAKPEEEAEAVELTDRKGGDEAKVVVDPSLHQAEQPAAGQGGGEPGARDDSQADAIGDSWFTKS